MKLILLLVLCFDLLYAQFCGENHLTYQTVAEAHSSGIPIIHCQSCGACSNLHDIGIYYVTRANMTDLATKCAIKAAIPFVGREKAKQCMIDSGAPLTDACMECWIDNMVCTRKKCLFVCAKFKLTGKEEDRKACLDCDEAKCGGEFGRCAGANRRRAGIRSDIDRDDHEICKSVDCDWESRVCRIPSFFHQIM